MTRWPNWLTNFRYAAVSSLGVSLHEMGRLKAKQERFDEARELYERSLTLSKEAGDVVGQSVNLLEMGRLATRQGDRTQGRVLLQRGLRLAKRSNDASLLLNYEKALDQLRDKANRNVKSRKGPAQRRP